MVNVYWNTRTQQRQRKYVNVLWNSLHSFIPFGLLPMKFKLNYISKLMDSNERYTHRKHEIWVIQSTGMHWLQNPVKNEQKNMQEPENERKKKTKNIKRHCSSSSTTEFNTVRQYPSIVSKFSNSIRHCFVCAFVARPMRCYRWTHKIQQTTKLALPNQCIVLYALIQK